MSKYKNEKAAINGHQFDSNKEALRYVELKMLESKGEIQDLELQKPFELVPAYKENGKTIERAVIYKADFVYKENGETIVEDVKPTDRYGEVSKFYKRTAAYKVFVIKRKLMLHKYGIKVREV